MEAGATLEVVPDLTAEDLDKEEEEEEEEEEEDLFLAPIPPAFAAPTFTAAAVAPRPPPPTAPPFRPAAVLPATLPPTPDFRPTTPPPPPLPRVQATRTATTTMTTAAVHHVHHDPIFCLPPISPATYAPVVTFSEAMRRTERDVLTPSGEVTSIESIVFVDSLEPPSLAPSVKQMTVICFDPPGGSLRGLQGCTLYPSLPSPPHCDDPTRGALISTATDPLLTT